MSSTDPARLDTRIPEKGFGDPDAALEAFLEWAEDQGLTLYAHQEEAILELFAGNHVVLDTPTGSGKSLVAAALHFKTFAAVGRSFYTAPIKALVSEKFFALCARFGAENVGMMTGDGAVNRDAPILCCTAEILANIALREGEGAWCDSVVMDEFHYYADRDRGMAWQLPLLTLPRTQFLLMSATLGDTTHIREDLTERTGTPAVEVYSQDRPVPLDFRYSFNPAAEEVDNLIRHGMGPVYMVHFTQRAAAEQAQALMSTNFCSKEEKRAIKNAVAGFRFDSPYGKQVQRYVLHGVGLHHAGLLPRYRMLMEKLAQQGLLKVICGTDTLGVGINVPIRTVLFTQLCKFDGHAVDLLTVRDFQQIAGRAGRAGYDTQGFVVAQAPPHVIENKRMDARITDPKKRRKMVKAKPPTRGFKHWDRSTFERMASSRPEALEPRFVVDHDRVFGVMKQAAEDGQDPGQGLDRLRALIQTSHQPEKSRRALLERVDAVVDQLEQVGVVQRDPAGKLTLDDTLQADFSLHHGLSLFLVDVIGALDAAAEDHVLDLLTMVEAILDDPRPVLIQQARKAKGDRIAELKAAGVPYEERMAIIEDISWPKPKAEWIYEFYNAYAEKHPWVAGESIRPKSILRDMVSRYASFPEYVKELGLERVEGRLLRYLSEAYKALVQNVPAEEHTEDLIEVMGLVRTTLGRVDASLVTEWEAMLAGADAPPEQPPPPVDVSADPKRFRARVRAELHLLVRALSLGDWDAAAEALNAHPEADWRGKTVGQAMAGFGEEFGAVAFDHRARLAHHTRVQKTAPHQWTVHQVLVAGPDAGEEGDETGWAIEGTIDLRKDTNPPGGLVWVQRIGD